MSTANPYLLSVAPSLDNLGLVVTNSARIQRRYFVYRIGYIPAGGRITDVPTYLPAWTAARDGYLPATTGVNRKVSALIEYFRGKALWKPVPSSNNELSSVPNVPAGLKASP